MLTCLRITDLAIISTLDVEFGPGLNIVTGETGAGKSILIRALKLMLGGRASADLVRTGASQAIVEAIFELEGHPELQRGLKELLDRDEEELVVRRVVKANGRSRAYINGTLASASQLAQLTRHVVDICSQHEHHRLAEASSHLEFLDGFAGLADEQAQVEACFEAFSAATEALDSATKRLRQRAEREVMLRFQLEELDAVAPVPGEEDDLRGEHDRLANAEELSKLTFDAEQVLVSGDGAVSGQLIGLTHRLTPLTAVDERLGELVKRLESLVVEAEDLGADLGRFHQNVVYDPARLRDIDERLAALRRLQRKYGGGAAELAELRASLRQEMETFDSLETDIEDLETALSEAGETLLKAATVLSKARHAAATTLGGKITRELSDLGMGDARVEVSVAARDERGSLLVEGRAVGRSGIDHVEFQIAPNRGEAPRPLHRVASGGELSRSLLAIKRVLASNGPRGLYVFDEVDTGVGGAIAESIGRKLCEVAHHHQVLCITHQPQIAAYANQHFHVRKAVAEGRTHSAIRRLTREERREELARMMGGVDITDATRSAAEDLLRGAERIVDTPTTV